MVSWLRGGGAPWRSISPNKDFPPGPSFQCQAFCSSADLKCFRSRQQFCRALLTLVTDILLCCSSGVTLVLLNQSPWLHGLLTACELRSLMSPLSSCHCYCTGTWGTTGDKDVDQSTMARGASAVTGLPGTDARPWVRGRTGDGVWGQDLTSPRGRGQQPLRPFQGTAHRVQLLWLSLQRCHSRGSSSGPGGATTFPSAYEGGKGRLGGEEGPLQPMVPPGCIMWGRGPSGFAPWGAVREEIEASVSSHLSKWLSPLCWDLCVQTSWPNPQRGFTDVDSEAQREAQASLKPTWQPWAWASSPLSGAFGPGTLSTPAARMSTLTGPRESSRDGLPPEQFP